MGQSNTSEPDDFWAMLLPENDEYDMVTEEDFVPVGHASPVSRIQTLVLIAFCCITLSVAGWAVRDSAAARIAAAQARAAIEDELEQARQEASSTRGELAGEQERRRVVEQALDRARQQMKFKDGQLFAKDGEVRRGTAALEAARQDGQLKANQLSQSAGELHRAEEALSKAQEDAESTKEQLGEAQRDRRRAAEALEKAEQDARIKGLALARKDDELRLVRGELERARDDAFSLRGQLAAVQAMQAANRMAARPVAPFGNDEARRLMAIARRVAAEVDQFLAEFNRGGTVPQAVLFAQDAQRLKRAADILCQRIRDGRTPAELLEQCDVVQQRWLELNSRTRALANRFRPGWNGPTVQLVEQIGSTIKEVEMAIRSGGAVPGGQ